MAFHQMTGGADRMLAEAARLLREADHQEQANLVEHRLVGRDILPGMWADQIVEAYDDTYYRVLTQAEEHVRRELAAGRRHLWEAEMQRAARSRRRP
ncbi:hypothetical protein ACFWP2_37855 [Kitasatospora sp. NPDC058444]|uniref:hypothetical protein n=1 Tax=Kitasatospora sp. NPDC058444 TaxID=3346504 RepID=UPI00364D111B